jgi:hypothetical protein
MPRICWRLAQRADRHDDPQPGVGAVLITLLPHLLDHLARLGCRVLAVKRDPLVRCASDIEVGDGHGGRA